MKVALGMSALLKGRRSQGIDGIGIYSQQLFSGLTRAGFVDVLPCSHNFADDGFDEKKVVDLGPFKRQMISSILTGCGFSGERYLPGDIALFHSLDHYIPRYKHVPTIATIHDTIPISNKEWFNPVQRGYHKALKRSMYWPDHVITVSDYSKSEIVKELGIPKSMVSVVYNGVEKSWALKPPTDKINGVLKKYGIPKNYVISVGTIQPRKNFEFLINSFRYLPEAIRKDVTLVIVGKPGANSKRICAKFKQEEEAGSFVWLDYVLQDELQILVAGAKAMAFPSLAEGFGMPVIESFAVGTPVISSSSTSLPEVAGNAAMLVSPYDIRDFSNGLSSLLSNAAKREQLIIEGQMRAKEFSWDAAVRKTVEVYEEVSNRFKKTREVAGSRRSVIGS